jgi:hypothetical protein
VELSLKHIASGNEFVKATQVVPGGEYLIVGKFDNQLVTAKPLAENFTYGYLYTNDVEEKNGVIEMANNNNTFTFEDAGQGLFYIKDCYGRYFYQGKNGSGNYYASVNLATTTANAHPYSATLQGDGTFVIKNTVSNQMMMTALYNSTKEFAFYATLNAGNSRPWLYERTSTTGIKSIGYDMPATVVYNLKGQRVMTPTKGLYIIGGRKVFKK